MYWLWWKDLKISSDIFTEALYHFTYFAYEEMMTQVKFLVQIHTGYK